MSDEKLSWTDLSSEEKLKTRVFTVRNKTCRSAEDTVSVFSVIDTSDWAVVIPHIGDNFLLVRQWRHGLCGMSLEFPGGTVDRDESPDDAAIRETVEETGFRPEKLIKLGELNPNPAIYTNKLHVYLAEGLVPVGAQNLDDDEFIDCIEVPVDDVIRDFGTGEYVHAFMGTAIGLYLRRIILGK